VPINKRATAVLLIVLASGLLATAAQAPEFTYLPPEQAVYWTGPADFGATGSWAPPPEYQWTGGNWQPPPGWVAPTTAWAPPTGWGEPQRWETPPEFR
jgi:hypothetical protein